MGTKTKKGTKNSVSIKFDTQMNILCIRKSLDEIQTFFLVCLWGVLSNVCDTTIRQKTMTKKHTSVVEGAKAAAEATTRAETTAENFMVYDLQYYNEKG